MQNNKLKGTVEQQVLIFPALFPAAEMSERDVYFLFSVTQVEDIIKELLIYPVPFSPSYTEGIAQWRDNVVPVISLEKCLNRDEVAGSNLCLEPAMHGNEKKNTRIIMVRSISEGNEIKRCAVRVIPPIRIFSLPIQCTPVSSVEWITKKHLVRAVYEWDEGYLVVPYMEKILTGNEN